MSIATTKQYWTSRYNGTDPAVVTGTNNEEYTATGSGASASGGYWVITDQVLSITPTTNEYTMLSCFYYNTAPDASEVLMSLDNGTHKAEVKVNGTKFSLVGTTTENTIDVDINASDDAPVILRLTLDSSGTAKLYLREIVYDWEGSDHFISVTGSSSSGSKHMKWGNTTGSVNWASVYGTHMGAFSPEELSPSSWTTDTLHRIGLSLVDTLRNSQRLYLKTHVDDSSIQYGFDLSSSMVSRLRPPTVHVVLAGVSSPTMMTLGGGVVEQDYRVDVYITTAGSDYKEAYKMGMEICGEVVDEVYTTTGLNGTTDSLEQFQSSFDSKMDDDENFCVHQLTFTYRRRVNMRKR